MKISSNKTVHSVTVALLILSVVGFNTSAMHELFCPVDSAVESCPTTTCFQGDENHDHEPHDCDYSASISGLLIKIRSASVSMGGFAVAQSHYEDLARSIVTTRTINSAPGDLVMTIPNMLRSVILRQ